MTKQQIAYLNERLEESDALNKKRNEEMELLNQEVQALKDKIMFDDAPSAITEMINSFERKA